MSKLFLLVVVSSKILFVASQNCDKDWQCVNGGCCVDSKCYLKSSWRCRKSCTNNWQCDSGCCKNNRCQATKYECNLCYYNYQCDSGCCEYNQCKDYCSESDYSTTAAPDSCIYDSCSYDDECCIDGECQFCYQTTSYPWSFTTTRGRTHSSAGSGLSVGASIGIALTVIFVVFLKLSLWGCYCARRKRVGLVRRRVTCVRVPILEHDHLQQEHERAEREISARLPPPYSPLPLEDRSNPSEGAPPVYTPIPTTSPNETTEPAQTQSVEGNTEVVQGDTMVPPPANPPNYSPNADQNANSAETSQTQGTGIAGNGEQANDVPQVPSVVPPPSNPANPSTHTSQNATEQNAQENTIWPFLT